uniref:Receptor activity-modifying protein 1-like n=1 Tax=Hippocampus comes TaxID=109280 RepID=A0A3Q2ZKB5_HIPCM
MARLSLGVVIVAGKYGRTPFAILVTLCRLDLLSSQVCCARARCSRRRRLTKASRSKVMRSQCLLPATVQNFSEPSGGWHRASTSESSTTNVKSSRVITKSFQEVEDLEPLRLGCRADALAELSVALCASPFEQQMATLEADARCVLDNIIGAYNELSVCLEELSHWCGCYYPNAVAHSAFLRVHSAYFAPCPPPPQEGHLEDAPRRLVLGLTLAPVALVPLLVYVVARRSGRTEPNAHR